VQKKIISVTLITLLILLTLSGIAGAQSTYLPTPSPPGLDVPAGWVKINILDRHELVLYVGGPSATLNANVPSQYEPYVLTWMSSNVNVATVVAASPATVTPVSVGSTWVMALVTSGNTTYYDACLVEVRAQELPRTAGTNFYNLFFGIMLLVAALPLLRRFQTEI